MFDVKAILISMFLLVSVGAHPQPDVILDGLPQIRISEYGVDREVEIVSPADAEELGCLVQRVGDQYYWVTRENTELHRFENGAFVTFVAGDGSGYIRMIDPAARTAFDGLSRSEGDFDYVEHVLLGLTTITYYGRLRDPLDRRRE